MRRLIFAISLVLQITPTRAHDSGALLGKATRAARSGALATDRKLVSGLEEIFRKTSHDDQRLSAAYLLTFVPSADLHHYVDFVRNHPDAEKALGPEALLRVLRLFSDEAYESGRFSVASEGYRLLLKRSTKPAVRAYASLKLGWSELNAGQTTRALTVWQQASAAKEAGALSPALWNGIGQAAAERPEKEIFERLGSLSLDPPLLASLIDGMAEEIENGRGNDAALTALTSRLPWRAKLVDALFQRETTRGELACRYATFLAGDSRAELTYQPFGKALESCVDWSQSWENGASRAKAWVPVLSRLHLVGAQRRPRFDLLLGEAHFESACYEGFDWMQETPDESEAASSIPVSALASACRTAARANSALGANLFERVTKLPRTRLSHPRAPTLAVLAQAFPESAFRRSFEKALLSRPERAAGTLLPRLLAERLTLEHEVDAAYALSAAAGSESREFWKSVAARKVKALLERGETRQAIALLDKESPPPLSPELWLAAIGRLLRDAPGDAGLAGRSDQVLVSFLEHSRALPATSQGALSRLSIERRLWAPLLSSLDGNRLKKISSTETIRVKSALFDAWVKGELSPGDPPADPELAFLSTLAQSLRTGDPPLAQIKSKGNGPLALDLQTLQRLEKRAVRALSPAGTPLNRVQRWLAFLQSARTTLKRTRFHSPPLSFAADRTLTRFCSSAAESIPELEERGGGIPRWKELMTTLSESLEECVNREEAR